mmetsp:Transcript_27201/g.40285  ORF Transcript_27201/g.40285 Transcript_27201/m.40285 type:complete len:84 (+) Transcript_27201:537-788(+)
MISIGFLGNANAASASVDAVLVVLQCTTLLLQQLLVLILVVLLVLMLMLTRVNGKNVSFDAEKWKSVNKKNAMVDTVIFLFLY